MAQTPIPAREMAKVIYLAGSRVHGYTVMVHRFDGMGNIDVSSAAVGNALVRTLRALGRDHPDWFPPSSLAAVGA